MQEFGFSSYKYWVAPYGVDDEEIITIPKRHGMNCLLTMGQHGHVTPTNCDRWHIPRCSLDPSRISDVGVQKYKDAIDACVADNGWLVIVTHVNEWDNTTTMDDALSTVIQYAIDSGMEVKNIPDAFETYKPFFYMSELF